MDDDHAMEEAPPAQFAQQISAAEFERQAVDFTTQAVERLNADVRATPAIGARSEFFQDEANVARGLPVFQGKHTRFVYDEEEDDIVAAVDVTQEALQNGPVVRTVAELDADLEEDEEEDEEEDDDDEAVHNTFYAAEGEQQDGGRMDDAHVSALLEDVEMELASVAIDEQRLLQDAALKQ